MRARDVLNVSFEFSPKLGVRDLPQLNARHESNIPGLYVVGDLADAPIIKAALNQGYDVANRLARELGNLSARADLDDVIVIGAGPAGIGAALALKEAGLRFRVLEKERPFNTLQNFPKAKLIFSEPRAVIAKGNFWFDDARREELLERWEAALDVNSIPIEQPIEVVDVRRVKDGFAISCTCGEGESRAYAARRVILATGRRGSVRRLEIPGEELDKVCYAVRDAARFRGRRVLVVGGGDAAVEAAIACASEGAKVTISYRGTAFSRAKSHNQGRLDALIAAGEIRAELGSQLVEVLPQEVVLKRAGATFVRGNDDVLVLIGTTLPTAFLERIGLRMSGRMDAWRLLWVLTFAFVTYCFYVLKSKKAFFPFGPDDFLGAVPQALRVDLGFRQVDAEFWGTCIYALLVLVFGVRAYRKYPSSSQRRRYLSLIGFQWLFLFALPELLAPLVIHVAGAVPDLLARPWKFYAIAVPWPLSIWSAIDGPGWGGAVRASTSIIWMVLGVFVAFVLVPLYVRYNGLRFCSYLCGCGGLAESLGDFWRHLAPRGRTSYQSEWFGRALLVLAFPVTLLIVNDAWAFWAHDALYDAKVFAQQWYGLMVDFWLASIVGVAMYPCLGNRVWCRFFCPLRAWMEVIARRFAKITIQADDKCIGCGECTRHCQMGIQVQTFAQRRHDLDNSNSSCIQCGICVQVCPMDVLSVSRTRRFSADEKRDLLAPAPGLE